jgi:hypothetical protein
MHAFLRAEVIGLRTWLLHRLTKLPHSQNQAARKDETAIKARGFEKLSSRLSLRTFRD